jgi:hypothetical protein
MIFAPGIPDLMRDIESVVSGYFSMSHAAPHLFGDRVEEFADEVRELLGQRSPEGVFWDWPAHGGCCCGHLLVEVRYGAQGDVDLHEFVWVQAAGEVAQALRVDDSGLLDQYPDILAEKFDGGMDHGSEGLRCRRGHEPG